MDFDLILINKLLRKKNKDNSNLIISGYGGDTLTLNIVGNGSQIKLFDAYGINSKTISNNVSTDTGISYQSILQNLKGSSYTVKGFKVIDNSNCGITNKTIYVGRKDITGRTRFYPINLASYRSSSQYRNVIDVPVTFKLDGLTTILLPATQSGCRYTIVFNI
jgi:hypothetical protein